MINIKGLRVQYDKKIVINDMNLNIKGGHITTIVGPNGCGKSTLLKVISKNLVYQGGEVFINGKNIKKIRRKELSKSLAILPQSPKAPSNFTVRELVSFGRYPFISFGKRFSKRDYEIIDWALSKTNMIELRSRQMATLSGGERQRAWIAMALAQEPKILLLDEPTTYLDIAHQFEVLELIKDIGKKMNVSIVMVLHDINHGGRYSDEIIMMKDGVVKHQGRPEETITEATMKEVFSLKGDFFEHSNYSHFIPLKKS